MTNRWYHSKEIGLGTDDDPYRPRGADIADGFSGNKAMDKAPIWLVRFYGDEATLDKIANMLAVQELSNVPDVALNNMMNKQKRERKAKRERKKKSQVTLTEKEKFKRNKKEWEQGFRVGK